MKKALILLLLLPFIGYSQTASELLVRWEGTRINNGIPSTSPMYYNTSSPSLTAPNAYMTAANFSGSNISFNASEQYGGFIGTGWPTSVVATTPADNTKYYQASITAGTGKKIQVKNFKFQYTQYCNAYKIIYIKSSTGVPTDANFVANGTVLATNTSAISGQGTPVAYAFPTTYYVQPGETLYIRIYGYQLDQYNNKWFVVHNSQTNNVANPNSVGPAIYGIISDANGLTATNDAITTTETVAVNNFNVLTNDVITGTTVNTLTVTQPATGQGSVTINTDKTINYNPGAYFGTTSFTYTIKSPSNTYTSTATVNVTVTPFASPVANADSATLQQDASVAINVLANDTYGASNTFTLLTATTPAHGTATVNAANTVITYTPVAGYSGADSFTYTVKDSNNKTATATVSITVVPYTSPTANADTATTGKNVPVTINALANDIAGSGTISSITISGTPVNGTATINAYSKVVFTPANNFTGTATVNYTVTNSHNKTATGTITITVVAVTAASAVNDSANTAKNTAATLNVLSNDNIGNSALTSLVIATNPTHGTAVVNTDNTVTYTPASNYTGADSFTYTITNAYNTSSTAMVSMTVIAQPATGALCGTYTIGTGGNYSTITAAVADLNTKGVQCAVTFMLTNTLYNEANGESFPIVINQFTGTSTTNTVTFKPATGKNVTVKVNDITVNNNNYQATAVFKLNGADNIIFDGSNTAGGTTLNLTLFNDNTLDYVERAVVWVASTGNNGSTNVTVKNTNIREGHKNQGGKFCMGIYSGSNTDTGSNNNHTINLGAATANNANLTIVNNDFTNVKEGIYILGGTATAANATNVVIQKNDLGSETNLETIILPAYLSNVNGFEYSENLIYNLIRDTADGGLASTGIYVTGNSQNGNILRNNIRDLTKTASENAIFAGIILESSNTASNIVVANNFILNVSGNASGSVVQNGFGIYISTGGGYKLYHNTVTLNTNQNGNGYSAALLVNNTVTATDVRNNIFVNNQTAGLRRCAIMVLKNTNTAVSTMFTNLDYNNYYSSDKVGFIGTGETDSSSANYIATFSVWQTTTGKDAASSNIAPVFAAVKDLHIDTANAQNTGINNTGTPIAIVTKDIDGQQRNTATPDMGADEWGPLTLPAPGSNDGIYCDSSTTWNGTAWSNGVPNANKDAIFNGNFTQTGGTFNACSVYVFSGASVNFISNSNAIVQHSVNVFDGATLTFESSSNLTQVENDQNTGTAVIKRKGGLLKRLDYTMWSAPVKDARTTGYQSLQAFSPFTSANRFYEFFTADNQYHAVASPSTTKFNTGEGYLIRMPNATNGSNTNPYFLGQQRLSYEGIFEGTPNNGNIRITLAYNDAADKRYSAVGNPYPSPISIRDFISQNIDVIDGTLYFWRKTNDATQTTYSAVNLEAYTANAAPGGNSADGNNLIADPYTIDADKGVLNTGQGFIVKAVAANKELVFKNNMRVTNNTNYFFKLSNPATNGETADVPNTQGRMWLNVTNTSGDFSQSVVAYNPATSLDFDNGYDGAALTAGNISLYSLLTTDADAMELIIQSRGNFVTTDKVALGYKAVVAGNFEIAIDHTDGLFNGEQNIYILDKLTGTTQNLKENSYTFETEIGTFNDRFEIMYTPQGELGTTTPVLDAKQLVVYRDGKQIKIQAPADINSVTVFDLLGKTLYTQNNIDGTEFSTNDINAAQQVLIVQITLDTNQVISKKIMMN